MILMEDAVQLSDDTTIETKTLIWAAGVKGNFLDGLPEESRERGKQGCSR